MKLRKCAFFVLRMLIVLVFMSTNLEKVYSQIMGNSNLSKSDMPSYYPYGRLADGVPNAEKLGWKVGIQYFSFHKYSFFEGIELTQALGLHYIEGITGMRISPESDETMYAGMPQEWKEKIKKRLNEAGVRMVSIFDGLEDGTGEGFEDLVKFCKEMGITTIVSNPKRADNGGKPVEFYEDILKKYGVEMFFANHPKPSPYWNPDFSVEDTKGRSRHIGTSVDFGHYTRTGYDPYEIVKRFIDIDKMNHFHMRDVSEIGPHGFDVPCGEGAGRLKETYQMLFDKKVRPLVMLEYEGDFYNSLPNLIKSVNWINQLCGEMIKAEQAKAQTGASIQLLASDASLSEGLRLQDSGAEATIHDWGSTNQAIDWNANLDPGNYLVKIRYSQPAVGSAVTLVASGQEIVHLFKPTASWYDYTTQDLGILKISKGGTVNIALRGIQLALNWDGENSIEMKEVGALPDIHWVELIPTKLEATSQLVDVISQFKGTPIFDGKTWSGWEENTAGSLNHFRITKGAIVGGNMSKYLMNYQFVKTQETYGDFELHLKFKVKTSSDSYNGGIQFRSESSTIKGKEFEMVGYQADIMGTKTGGVYDESRRDRFLGNQIGALQKGYNPKEWNNYVIRCDGPRVRTWINGIKITDYIEPFTKSPHPQFGTIPMRGHIGLQIHAGEGHEVWYKDIEIQEFTVD